MLYRAVQPAAGQGVRVRRPAGLHRRDGGAAGRDLFDTLPGLFIGIGVSMLLLIYRPPARTSPAGATRAPTGATATSTVTRTPSSPHTSPSPRIESGLYFANMDAVRARILQAAAADGFRAVVIDAETVPFLDVTAARMLAAPRRDCTPTWCAPLLARDVGQVRDVLRHVVDDAALTRCTQASKQPSTPPSTIDRCLRADSSRVPLPRQPSPMAPLRHSRVSTVRSVDWFEFVELPGLVEPRLQRAVEPEELEPRFAGDRLTQFDSLPCGALGPK